MILAIIAIYYISKRYKNHDIQLGVMLLWDLFWIIAVIITFLGDFTTLMSNYIGFKRGLDLIISAAIALILYFTYQTIDKVKETQETIKKLDSIIDEMNKNKQ